MPSLPARILALVLLSGIAQADGLTPKEARDRMVVPEGFTVEVFASEPDIRQPVAACFDERGRMWVIEYLQYPTPAGLVPVKVDQYLRTEYDRLPEPPPKGPKGADRIKILEDTDGDGKADKVTIFAEGLNLASGIAVGHGGVWVGQAPYLLFFPDKNRDDKPDGDPVVKLSGFGLQDAHATLNSLTWGPDGWLYGAQGSTVTAQIRGIEFQQGVWRYHPKTDRFELFAEGGGNTWGVDFDRGGNLFGSSNGGFIAFHMVQGGNYWKGFAKHGPLHNPRAYGYFDSIAYSGPKPGGHVTPGGIIYKGEQFPQEFRGAFLGANLLSNNVYWYKLAPKGSTFSMTLGGTLLESKDPWFRPIDMLTGPDGSVYVVDWYDKRASHLDPRDTWDKSNGRIYKISYGTPEKVLAFDLAKLPTNELIAMRDRPNDWWSETARRVLYERADFREAADLFQRVSLEKVDEAKALRDLFALSACDGIDEAKCSGLLFHPLPGVRRWAVRFLGDRDPVDRSTLVRLGEVATGERNLSVRSQLASNCIRWGPRMAIDIIMMMRVGSSNENHRPGPLSVEGDSIDDPHIPLLTWWAIEHAMRSGQARLAVERLTARREGLYPETIRREVLPRMARTLSEDGRPEDLDLCARLLDRAQTPTDRELILAGMARGLEGGAAKSSTPQLGESLARIDRDGTRSLAHLKVAVRLGSETVYKNAIDRVLATKADPDRLVLIELIGSVTHPEGLKALLDILGRDVDDETFTAIFSALGRYSDDEIAGRILVRYPLLQASVQSRAIDLLKSRKSWSEKLVGAIGPKGVPAADLKVAQALQIAAFGDTDLTAKLEAAWGRLPTRDSGAKVRRIAEVRGILPEGDKGDPARGRSVFQTNCMACHRLFGEGERIGPELTGSERGDLDFLLASLIDPSAVIRKEYQGQTLALKDGRVLSGLIVDEDGTTVTLFDSQKQKTTIPKTEIEARKASEVSVMPEGMLDTLKEDQVRDLFRYLQSAGH